VEGPKNFQKIVLKSRAADPNPPRSALTYFREDCVSRCCIPGDIVGECGIPVGETQSPSHSIVEEEGALHK